eukprot:scaffold1809_cov386-Prasinococcus_capsulatus_cf.AAC.56
MGQPRGGEGDSERDSPRDGAGRCEPAAGGGRGTGDWEGGQARARHHRPPKCLRPCASADPLQRTGNLSWILYAVSADAQESDRAGALLSLVSLAKVLNLVSAWWFERTRNIVDNALLSVPHANVSVMKSCKVFPVEFVVRGYITGSTRCATTIITPSCGRGSVRPVPGSMLTNGLPVSRRLQYLSLDALQEWRPGVLWQQLPRCKSLDRMDALV